VGARVWDALWALEWATLAFLGQSKGIDKNNTFQQKKFYLALKLWALKYFSIM